MLPAQRGRSWVYQRFFSFSTFRVRIQSLVNIYKVFSGKKVKQRRYIPDNLSEKKHVGSLLNYTIIDFLEGLPSHIC